MRSHLGDPKLVDDTRKLGEKVSGRLNGCDEWAEDVYYEKDEERGRGGRNYVVY